jgi:hypothetical protein
MNTRRCPKCDKANNPERVNCWYCGNRFHCGGELVDETGQSNSSRSSGIAWGAYFRSFIDGFTNVPDGLGNILVLPQWLGVLRKTLILALFIDAGVAIYRVTHFGDAPVNVVQEIYHSSFRYRYRVILALVFQVALSFFSALFLLKTYQESIKYFCFFAVLESIFMASFFFMLGEVPVLEAFWIFSLTGIAVTYYAKIVGMEKIKRDLMRRVT